MQRRVGQWEQAIVPGVPWVESAGAAGTARGTGRQLLMFERELLHGAQGWEVLRH